MDFAADFLSLQEQLKSKLVRVTRTVGQLASEDLNFFRSSSSEISESLDEESGRLISLTSSLLKTATAGVDLPVPVLRDDESIDDNWREVVDVIDALLERADACLDEFTGVIKKLSPSQQEQAITSFGRKDASTDFPNVYGYGPSKIPKPQLQFVHPPDNTDLSPFRPLLRTKPHAIVPLENSINLLEDKPGYQNPYETEIRSSKFPPSVYDASSPIDPKPIDSTTATFVDTIEGVNEMLAELKLAKEIAIDLEHHDVHSYHGLVSLMQISTREKDWVIDTLKPWREELQLLNEVFANPNILKVLHGASMDVIWLQRDLGLYIVNMFDTYHAACALNYPKRSLKYLLSKFLNFEADKKYQMADWRTRPLPQGMFDYARSDTHFLLNIYDRLRNELLENSIPQENLIDYVQEQSQNVSLQRYERPVYDAATGMGPGGWYDYLSRSPAALGKEQFAVFKAVHQWRDEVARAEDEAVQCVFPKHFVFKLARIMPLDQGTLFKTLSPVTPIVKDRASGLLEVIRNAKIAGADGPEWKPVVKPVQPVAALAAIVSEGKPTLVPPQVVDGPSAGRCNVSQFWGATLNQQTPSKPFRFSFAATTVALQISLPLPPIPMIVSEPREKLANTAATPPTSASPYPAVVSEESSQIFTVKDLGGHRKRKIVTTESSDDVASSQVEDLEPTAETSEKSTKKQRRRQKKERRKPVADRASESEQVEDGRRDSAPFDYATAESVLHAQPVHVPAGQQSSRRFNPYAKALDAPNGVRKAKKETAGKTFTFRQ